MTFIADKTGEDLQDLISIGNFLWPSVILRSKENMTISVALKALEDSNHTPYHLIMAGSVISVLPLLIIVLVFQKQLISGLIEGAVKG